MSTEMVRLETKVKKELEKFRSFEKETYSDIIQRLVNVAKDSEELSENEIRQIESSLEDIKKGRVLSLKEAEKQWGI